MIPSLHKAREKNSNKRRKCTYNEYGISQFLHRNLIKMNIKIGQVYRGSSQDKTYKVKSHPFQKRKL